MKRRIHFILTGGTINKAYDPVTEKPEITARPLITDYLDQKIKPHLKITSEIVCLKDSLDLTERDRKNIAAAVHKTKADKIIIVHGTSTMPKTAAFLKKALKGKKEKTVILVGAMIPLQEFAMSDAGFNLGYAIGAAEHLAPGVYVCMNAKTFKAGQVKKNTRIARFVGK